MASAASGHTAAHVECDMAAAEAIQYQAIWLEMQGNVTAAFDAARCNKDKLL
jgi:hypothetical protein